MNRNGESLVDSVAGELGCVDRIVSYIGSVYRHIFPPLTAATTPPPLTNPYNIRFHRDGMVVTTFVEI